MKYTEIIKTANGNLRKSKLRTFLTSSAIFMGALTLMLTTGVGAGLKTYVEEQVNAAGAKDALLIFVKTANSGPVSNNDPKEYDPNKVQATRDFTSVPTLTNADLEKIKAEKGILSIDPLYSVNPEYISAGGKKFVANIGQSVEGLKVPLKAGSLVEARSKTPQITIAPAFTAILGFNSDKDAVNKPVMLGYKDSTGRIFEVEAVITGVQEKTLIQGNAMNANLALLEQAHDKVTAGLPEAARTRYPGAVAKYDISMSNQELKDLKNKLGTMGYRAQTLEDQLGIITNVINGIIAFLNIFAAIALAAASFGIVNTLLMAVQERTREIGLMKALGLSRGRIFALFSLEAVLMGLWGSSIALVAANLLGRVGSNIAARTIFKNFEGLSLFSFPLKSMVPIILLIMLIAFLAATLPARRASRLDPIEALRYE